jgi:hypothetical protein
MLQWDPDSVADFFGSRPELDDNSIYTFSFPLLSGTARLQVTPYFGEIALAVDVGNQRDAVRWQLECAEIVRNEEPEEGGVSLAFIPERDHKAPKSPMHWVVIGRDAGEFQILTVLRNPDKELP